MEIGHKFTEDEIVCPYCGCTNDDYECVYQIDQDIDCEECGKTYILTEINTSTTYSTRKKYCHEIGEEHDYNILFVNSANNILECNKCSHLKKVYHDEYKLTRKGYDL